MAKATPKQVAAGKMLARASKLASREGISKKVAYARLFKKKSTSGGSKAVAKRSTKSVSKKRSTSKAAPRGPQKIGIGRAYQAANQGLCLGGPAITLGLDYGFNRMNARSDPVGTLQKRIISPEMAANVAITAADTYLDKKVGQAAALSRKSVTAWLPEAVKGWSASSYERQHGGVDKGTPTRLAYRWMWADRGIVPGEGNGDISFNTNGGVYPYRTAKHGGQAVRLFANRTKIGRTISAPIKKMLSMVGLSL